MVALHSEKRMKFFTARNMNRFIACYLLFYLFLASSNAIAENAIQSSSTGLNGRTVFYDWHYKKYEEPGFMNLKSRMPLSISIGMRDETNIRQKETKKFNAFSYNLEASYGLVKYTGSGTDNHSYHKLLAEGYFPISDSFYVGVAYRRLFDDFGPGTTSTSAATYDRLSTYVYAPLGYNLRQADGSNLKVQYNYFVSGTQTSYLSQVPGYLTNLKNKQDAGYGLDLSYTAADGSWETYFRYWSIADSDIASGVTVGGIIYGYEPKNSTSEIGIRLTF